MFISGTNEKDAHKFVGVWTNPNNPNEWSTQPYDTDQRKYDNHYHKVVEETKGKRTFEEEYELILEKKSNLPRSTRDWLVKNIDGYRLPDFI